MDLKKLFETQQALDEKIYEKHPELKGQNNLDWKVLALQVELSECANEWRGFKKWSNDQEPRNHVHAGVCSYCGGTGEDDTEEEYFECDMCGGEGEEYVNPLLEEYVDCLHFLLSIGLEMNIQDRYADNVNFNIGSRTKRSDALEEFKSVFRKVALFDMHRNKQSFMEIFSSFATLGDSLGFVEDEVEAAYFEKNKVNHKRQASGY